MDILDIKAHNRFIEITHPSTKEKIGITVEIISLDDDRVKKVENQLKNKALRRGRNTPATAELIDANTYAILCAAVVGWEFKEGTTLGGLVNPPCNEQNKITLFKVPFIFKQINEALEEEADFFQ